LSGFSSTSESILSCAAMHSGIKPSFSPPSPAAFRHLSSSSSSSSIIDALDDACTCRVEESATHTACVYFLAKAERLALCFQNTTTGHVHKKVLVVLSSHSPPAPRYPRSTLLELLSRRLLLPHGAPPNHPCGSQLGRLAGIMNPGETTQASAGETTQASVGETTRTSAGETTEASVDGFVSADSDSD
jgi:hypothetical protein